MRRTKKIMQTVGAMALTVALFVTGCGNGAAAEPQTPAAAKATESAADDGAAKTEENSGKPEEKPADQPAEAAPENTSGETLVERLVGKYSCPNGVGGDFGEFVTLELMEFGGNLYGFGGNAYGEDSSDTLSVYSYWGMEFIPESPEALLDTKATKCRVGILTWSNMSNLGQYWSAPRICTIELTKDGIRISSEDGEVEPLTMAQQVTDLTRDDRVEDTFVCDVPGAEPEKAPKDTPGFWQERDGDAKTCMDIREDGLIRLWRKVPGEHVLYGTGKLYKLEESLHDYEITYTLLGNGGMPESLELSMEIDGSGSLVVKAEDEIWFRGSDTHVMLSTKEDTVPLMALAQPDDPEAYGAHATVNIEGQAREVIPQFVASDDIENNGGNFVRVGKLIFYRHLDLEGKRVSGLWGDFITQAGLQENSEIRYIDTRTGEIGVACRNVGFGPLYYLDGQFWSHEELRTDGEYAGQAVYRFWPDGSGKQPAAYANDVRIAAVSGNNRYLAFNNYQEESTYLSDGSVYIHEFERGKSQSVFHVDFAGNEMLVFDYDTDSGKSTLTEICPDDTMEQTVLGELPKSEWSSWGYPSIRNIAVRGDDAYIGLVWYDGTAMMFADYAVVHVTLHKENSLEVIRRDLPEGMDTLEDAPYLWLDDAGKVHYMEHKPGTVGLSQIRYGDLVRFETPDQEIVLKKDFIPEYPFNVQEGVNTSVLQTAELVDGKVFVIYADAFRAMEEDIGWREAYVCDNLHWLCIEPADGSRATTTEFDTALK